MTSLPSHATAPGHVRAVDFGHVLVLIDYRTGRVHCLLPEAGAGWRAAAATGCLDPIPPTAARRLLASRLLIPTPAPNPWTPPVVAPAPEASWGSTEHPAGLARPPRGPTAAASWALAAVFAVKRAGPAPTGMHRLTAVLRSTVSTCLRPATPAQAIRAVEAVRRAGWRSPGRTACLEESAAAVLLLAARRLAVTWCHGVAADPVRLHAWVQTWDGTTAAEPDSTRAYTPVITIGDPHHQP
ncbi:lasso peptide biosynthesis B2 protein [Streptomyces atratus]|uniref:Transglutaminase-like superfamily protein n=1 Tax=Streptomyces atratus TaxID=1893 RepID=A0A1K1WMZ5_STRAR|nr:lasso peptide biosynthesis B2 protein [Streptomyces atratus]SFX38718.1 Transglutaminase-like superfamily protein [Streptomyces atratus]